MIFQNPINFKNLTFLEFYEDMLDKEVRCPTCLGCVQIATKPINCRHVYCSYCIKKWLKDSNKCNICRVSIKKLVKIDILDDSVDSQSDLFCLT